jgi:hypothetical protein
VAGASLKEVVFRSIHTHRNAELLLRAKALGTVTPLTRGETEQACDYSLRERPMGRAWEYWVTRLTKAGELPPRTRTRVGGKGVSKPKPRKKSSKRR